MAETPFATRGERETNPRWRDEPSPLRLLTVHPVVAAVGDGAPVPHRSPWFSEIRDERGLRVQFSVAIMRPKDLRTPWVLVDDFDLRVIEPNRRVRKLSIDFIAERARQRGLLVKAYAKAHNLTIGYIPYVPGAKLDRDSIEFAKMGGIVPLLGGSR